MDTNGHQRPERIRAGLSHPIIDADDFRDFTFAEGTAVAKAAAALLAGTPAGVGR